MPNSRANETLQIVSNRGISMMCELQLCCRHISAPLRTSYTNRLNPPRKQNYCRDNGQFTPPVVTELDGPVAESATVYGSLKKTFKIIIAFTPPVADGTCTLLPVFPCVVSFSKFHEPDTSHYILVASSSDMPDFLVT